ncbi:hypothetical protein KAR48_21160 [bacterium]|nr:hypothetical protein [bacterium]
MAGEKLSEFEKFKTNPVIHEHKSTDELLVILKEMANKHGFQKRFFKMNESKLTDAVVALSRKNLRLYCGRFGNILLILGNGGIKKTQTYNQDALLNAYVKEIAFASNRVEQRIKDKEIKYSGNLFKGNLEFTGEDL